MKMIGRVFWRLNLWDRTLAIVLDGSLDRSSRWTAEINARMRGVGDMGTVVGIPMGVTRRRIRPMGVRIIRGRDG